MGRKPVVYAIVVAILLTTASLRAEDPAAAPAASSSTSDIISETSALANSIDPFGAFAVFVVLMAQRIRAAATLPQDFKKMKEILQDLPHMRAFNEEMKLMERRHQKMDERYEDLRGIFNRKFETYSQTLESLKKKITELRRLLPPDMDAEVKKRILHALDHWKEHDISLLEKLLEKRNRPEFFDKDVGATWLTEYRGLKRQESQQANDVVHAANKITREVNPELPEKEKFQYFSHRSPTLYGETKKYVRDPGLFWTRGGESKSLHATEMPEVMKERCAVPLAKVAGLADDLRLKGTVWGAFKRVPDILSPIGTSLSLVAVFYATYATARESYRKYGSLFDPFNPNGKAATERRARVKEASIVDSTLEDRSPEAEQRLQPFVDTVADGLVADREALLASVQDFVRKNPEARFDKKRLEAILADRGELQEKIRDAIPKAARKEWPNMRFGQLLKFLALAQPGQLPTDLPAEALERYRKKVHEKHSLFLRSLLQTIFVDATTDPNRRDDNDRIIGAWAHDSSERVLGSLVERMSTTNVPVPANVRDHVAFPNK